MITTTRIRWQGGPRSKKTLILAFILLFAGLSWECRPKGKRAHTQGSVRVHIDAEPAHLLNWLRPDIWAHRIADHQVLESLVRIHPKTLDLIPELARSWRMASDGREIYFRLRKGVKWHDGHPFGVDDVLYTFHAILDPKSVAAATRGSLKGVIESVSATKEGEIRVVCKSAPAFVMQAVSFISILPAHLFKGSTLLNHPRLKQPLGTGPWVFDFWHPGAVIELKRNEKYWGVKPRIKRLKFRYIREANTAFNLLLKGEIDFMPRLRRAQLARFEKRSDGLPERFKLHWHLVPGIFYLLLNHNHPALAKLPIRQALASLVDKRTITGELLQGMAQPAHSAIWHGDVNHDPKVGSKPFSIEAAAAKLDAAGYRADKKLRRPLKLKLLVPAASKSTRVWLTHFQEQARKVGVKITMETVDWSIYLDRLAKRDFDLAVLGMQSEGPISDLFSQFHSGQTVHGQNYSGYSNPKVDDLLTEIRRTADDKQRMKKSSELQKILSMDVAVIPVYTLRQPALVHKRIKGVYASPMWFQLRDWWI